MGGHTIIIQPDDGLDPVISAIARATKTLRVKMFTLTDPTIVRTIIEAHGRGVNTRVQLNPQRSSGTRANDDTFRALTEAKVPVQWTNPTFVVTHEKSMVVDDTRALISTFNFCEKYFTKTRDYGVLTEVPEEVQEVAAGFDADWNREEFVVDDKSRLLWSVANSRDRMAEFIDEAKHSVEVQHPKYCDVSILDRLVNACNRGVAVRVLCGGLHPISPADVLETTASLRVLHHAGAKVHVMKHPKVHCKLIVRDRHGALIGSMNIDRHAFELRRELGIQIDEKSNVKRLREVFERDWSDSKKYDTPDPLEAIKEVPEDGHDPAD